MMKEVSGNNKQTIPSEMLEILACPACEARPPVELTPDKQYLKCTQCHRKYVIKNGIPVMLVDEAIIEK